MLTGVQERLQSKGAAARRLTTWRLSRKVPGVAQAKLRTTGAGIGEIFAKDEGSVVGLSQRRGRAPDWSAVRQ